MNNSSEPLITAVMVTGMHPARYSLARVAIQCFVNQTYQNKELLIINHGCESLIPDPTLNIREILLVKKDTETIGDLRNIAFDEAKGDFLLCWDDDDWYDPQRMAVQFNAYKDGASVLLLKQIRYNMINNCAFYETVPNGIPGTVLHPRKITYRYPSLTRGSDTEFIRNFKYRIVIQNDPSLYIRFYHGLNLWDAEHIMQHLANPGIQNKIELSKEHTQKVAAVLIGYSEWRASQ